MSTPRLHRLLAVLPAMDLEGVPMHGCVLSILRWVDYLLQR